jgi:hypothetical protein
MNRYGPRESLTKYDKKREPRGTQGCTEVRTGQISWAKFRKFAVIRRSHAERAGPGLCDAGTTPNMH